MSSHFALFADFFLTTFPDFVGFILEGLCVCFWVGDFHPNRPLLSLHQTFLFCMGILNQVIGLGVGFGVENYLAYSGPVGLMYILELCTFNKFVTT